MAAVVVAGASGYGVVTAVVSGGRLAGRCRSGERPRRRRGADGGEVVAVTAVAVVGETAKKGKGMRNGSPPPPPPVVIRLPTRAGVYVNARILKLVCVSARRRRRGRFFTRPRAPSAVARRAARAKASAVATATGIVVVAGGAVEAAERCGPPRRAFARYSAAAVRERVCHPARYNRAAASHRHNHSSAGSRLTSSTVCGLLKLLLLSLTIDNVTHKEILSLKCSVSRTQTFIVFFSFLTRIQSITRDFFFQRTKIALSRTVTVVKITGI